MIASMVLGHHVHRSLLYVAKGNYTGGAVDLSRKTKIEVLKHGRLSHFLDDFWPDVPPDSFQPEPGCSEPTFIGSQSEVIGLVGMMLSKLGREMTRDSTAVASSHLLTASGVDIGNEGFRERDFYFDADICLRDNLDGYAVKIAPQAFAQLQAWVRQSEEINGPLVETGGHLFGERNDAARVIWVSEVSGPPPDSKASPNGFVCGIEGVAEASKDKSLSSGGSTRFVGMWHTHPKGSPKPSDTDYQSMWDIVDSPALSCPRSLLLIIGTARQQESFRATSLLFSKPESTDGRREESGRGGEGATGEIAWVPFGVGRSADGLHRRTGAPMAVCGSCDARDGERIRSRELSRTGLARVCGDLRLSGGWVGRRRCRQAGSGMARSRAKARLNFSAQGQRSGRCRVNRRAERVSRPAREKNRRRRVLVVAIRSPRPIRAVQRARLWPSSGWPARRRWRRSGRGEMVQPDAVLEVAYGILDLGVAAMVSLQFEQLPVPVGDEAVIAVFGEEGELGTGRRLHPPDDEPYRRGVRLGLEGGAGGLGHIGGTVHPVRNRRPGIFGYRLDEIVQAFVLADGDGVADIDPAADGDHGVGIEAAVGTHGELPAGTAVANPAHRFTQEVGGAASGVGPALAQAGHKHVAGAGGDGQQRVIAPRAGPPCHAHPTRSG